MKHVFTMTLMVLAVAMVGCQKANDTTRVGNSGPRSGGATTSSIPNNLVLNGIVWRSSSEQNAFQQAVGDFLEAQIDSQYVGDVSSQGANQTGVFVAGRVELTTGQPLNTNPAAPIQNIAPNSELLVAVYDHFSNQSNLPALPVTYLKQATGYVQNGQVVMDFFDSYGHVRLDGQLNGATLVLHFNYQTDRTFDGKQGYAGKMGDLYIPTCQFFRCQ